MQYQDTMQRRGAGTGCLTTATGLSFLSVLQYLLLQLSRPGLILLDSAFSQLFNLGQKAGHVLRHRNESGGAAVRQRRGRRRRRRGRGRGCGCGCGRFCAVVLCCLLRCGREAHDTATGARDAGRLREVLALRLSGTNWCGVGGGQVGRMTKAGCSAARCC
ncbi:hypothetical protein F4802DRAFT_85839 [Xylaria palmicola]|nr:hypothetical protein F4802DRAFT_85839 [Xylaria palmicola]